MKTPPHSLRTRVARAQECFVYKIPPLRSESGHRANDWDVNKWLWQGRARVAAAGNKLSLYLEDAETGALFAACPVNEPGTGPTSVEPVTDSSRYFVLRIEDSTGKHAYIGMGFRERPDAYEFNATIADHWKGVRREREAEEVRRRLEQEGDARPALDLSLKEGQTLTIDLGHHKRDKPRRHNGSPSGPVSLTLDPPPKAPTLAPPPSSGPAAPSPKVSPTAAPAAPPIAHTSSMDDFGDFTQGSAADGDEFGEFQ